MKRIIRNKVYETEKAKLIGVYTAPISVSDKAFTETLYRKKTGEFFLHGQGGSESRYAHYAYGVYAPGEKIEPLSYDKAQEWARQHLSDAEYDSAFYEPVTEDKQTVHLYIKRSVLSKAKTEATKQGISLSTYIESLIS